MGGTEALPARGHRELAATASRGKNLEEVQCAIEPIRLADSRAEVRGGGVADNMGPVPRRHPGFAAEGVSQEIPWLKQIKRVA